MQRHHAAGACGISHTQELTPAVVMLRAGEAEITTAVVFQTRAARGVPWGRSGSSRV
jgi:hypothetical protein